MTNKTALKEKTTLPNIANDEWPALSELTAGRFNIDKKSKVTDIESLAQTIATISVQDDKVIQKNIDKDEKILKNNNLSKVKRKIKPNENVDINEANIINEDNKVNINSVNDTNNQFDIGNNLNIVKDEHIKEEVVENIISVTPQTTTVTTSSLPKNISKVSEPKLSLNGLLKFAALGFAHLYVKRTTSVLKPLGFVAEHFEKVFVAMMHIIIPMVMTWLLTTKVDILATQLSQKTALVSFLCSAVFYIACVFLWVSAQVVSAGIYNMLKRTLRDVAKVGEENT